MKTAVLSDDLCKYIVGSCLEHTKINFKFVMGSKNCYAHENSMFLDEDTIYYGEICHEYHNLRVAEEMSETIVRIHER